jgi:uncharacterized membrane protein YhfC
METVQVEKVALQKVSWNVVVVANQDIVVQFRMMPPSVQQNAQLMKTVPVEKVASRMEWSAMQDIVDQMRMMLPSVMFPVPMMRAVRVEKPVLLVLHVQRRLNALRDVRTVIPTHRCHVQTPE